MESLKRHRSLARGGQKFMGSQSVLAKNCSLKFKRGMIKPQSLQSRPRQQNPTEFFVRQQLAESSRHIPADILHAQIRTEQARLPGAADAACRNQCARRER